MTTRDDETASTPPSTRAASAAPSGARLTSRRQALGLVAAVGAAGALAACGGGSTTTTQSGTGNGSPAPRSTGGGGNGAGGGGGASGGKGTALVATASVPVGGGKILSDPNVVVTQPTKGEFKAFSSICTHMSCPVSQIQNGLIMCPCHGSEYKISDGSVVAGPAPRPLPPVKIKVSGGQVLQA
jgi:Rieske Fe-S protein